MDTLLNLNWNTLVIEALMTSLIEGAFIIIVGAWLIWRGRRALREGRFDGMVLFSFNLIEQTDEGTSQLGFRTPLTGNLQDIFHSDSLIKEINKAAQNTTTQAPVIRLKNRKVHSMMQRHLINFCNELNRDGQLAALTGQPYIEISYRLALVYEPSAKAKMFRIIPINERLIDEINSLGDQLTFGLPYHADRIVTLKAIEKELIADHGRDPEARTLAPFVISAPDHAPPPQS
jgi:hypothetical protein